MGKVSLLALAAVAALWLYPPSDSPSIHKPASLHRAFEAVQTIAERPHPVGSVDHGRVLDYLRRRLTAAGLSPTVDDARLNGYRIRDVYARLKGSASTGTVYVVAHYDSVPTGPGAADDGAAAASVLETAKAMAKGPRPLNDVVFLLTDGEEAGLLGSRAFVAGHALHPDRDLVLNFEARGDSGPTLMFQSGHPDGWLIRTFARAAPYPAANSLMEAVYRHMPNDTDFTVFDKAGLTGLNFAFIGGYTSYHTKRDTPENLSRGSLGDHLATMLAVTRAFANANLKVRKGEDQVYFDVLGRWLLSYPMHLVWILSFLGVLLFVVAAWYAGGRGSEKRADAIIGCGVVIAEIAGATALCAGISIGIRELFPGRIYEPSGGTIADPWFFGCFAAAAVAVTAFTCSWARHRFGSSNVTIGALFCWAFLLVASMGFLPAGSFLPLLPLVAGSLSLLILAVRPSPAGKFVAGLLAAAVVVVFAPFTALFFTALTLRGAFLVVPLVVLLAATWEPFLESPLDVGGSAMGWTATLTGVACLGVGIVSLLGLF